MGFPRRETSTITYLVAIIFLFLYVTCNAFSFCTTMVVDGAIGCQGNSTKKSDSFFLIGVAAVHGGNVLSVQLGGHGHHLLDVLRRNHEFLSDAPECFC